MDLALQAVRILDGSWFCHRQQPPFPERDLTMLFVVAGHLKILNVVYLVYMYNSQLCITYRCVPLFPIFLKRPSYKKQHLLLHTLAIPCPYGYRHNRRRP
jgi:hypothetical protein